MDAADSFDPQKLGRYSVIRVYYEYANQPAEEKLFVVLKHDKQNGVAFCWCIKATSKAGRYLRDPDLLAGSVAYKKGDIAFFPADHTIIDPENFITMLHATLASEAKKGRYRIEGKMPADFHPKIIAAIRKNQVLEPKKAKKLLQLLGEDL